MGCLADIATHLVNGGVGKVGVDIFVDTKPIDVNVSTVIVIRQYDGFRDPYYCGELRETLFELVVQGPDYPTTEAKAESASVALRGNQLTVGNSYIYSIYATSEPIPVGREASGVETFVVKAIATWRTA